jgi:hypothetical protein
MKKYIPQEYWSVYDSMGRKVADCGWERDAKRLSESRSGTYRKSNHELPGPVIDVTPPPALPTNEIIMADGYSTSEDEIIVNMDGGVGGSWKQVNPKDDCQYEHINDDPHDGWWLRPEHRDDVLPQLQESTLEPLDLK